MLSTLKLAVKVLLRRKFFTFVSLFAVTFTLLVLLVSAAMLDGIFGPNGPEDRPDRTLVVLKAESAGKESRRNGWAGYGLLARTFPDMPGVERSTIFAEPRKLTTYHEGRKITVMTRRTDGEFWKVFRFDFVEGGPYDTDAEAQALPVVVLNESTRDRFFGARRAVGKTLELDGRRLRVVGVVRDVPSLRFLTTADMWFPTSLSRSDAYKKELVGDFAGVMILAPGAEASDVSAEFRRRVATVPMDDPRFDTLTASAVPLLGAVASFFFFEQLDSAGPTVMFGVLWLMALAFMALPALNLVNLNLSRILERAGEIGVRKSFGATSWTLVRQFLMENIVLVAIGGLHAALATMIVLAILNRSGLIPYATLSLNYRVLGWGMLLTLVFGIVSGVLPAWRMSRLHPVGALQGRFE
ncbi:MAG TPA: ABC transporter permease [Candidatus Bathyarchaeia archaeon]|nr:ABC transporter permease [Candidatus Bathyarchaeia archaeon]